MDERVWRLPGPRSFVRDIVAEHGRGRHVATVLPEALASDVQFTDGLGVAVLDEFARLSVSARRIYDAGQDRSILDTFSQALIFDDPPATVDDATAPPGGGEHRRRGRRQGPGERPPGTGCRDSWSAWSWSRTPRTNQAQRLSIVAILERGQLPAFRGGASSDIAMTSIWWWARMARWDVAAHIADLAERGPLQGVLADVRTESIVEVARWDLDLAEHLMTTWEGEPGHLPSAPEGLAERIGSGYERQAATLAQEALRPPNPVLPSWDQRAVEGWHDHLSAATCSLAAEPDKLSRLVWAAQARVLLPWIEERRATLHIRVTQLLGAPRLASILDDWFDPPVDADGLVEIGALDRVIRKALGSRNAELRDASRWLREARNRLAHMRPLSLGEQESLLAACQFLL